MRAEAGFADSDVVIATFGHIAWTKWGDRLLDAFLGSELREDATIHLMYVGELAKDPFGATLATRIAAAGLGQRIRVTGFLSETDYERHLRIVDLAIQLRTKSRGGTPKGVLDCLAYGVPVIVNADASYRDYPDDVVVKLPAEPADAEMSQALVALARSVERRQEFARRGRHYVAERHDPETCARQYASAIHEFVDRERVNHGRALVTLSAPLVARTEDSATTVGEFSAFAANRPSPAFRRRRIFMDVSFIAVHDHESGIQRVVKKVVHHFYTMDAAGFEPVAVHMVNSELRVASEWLTAKGLLHPSEADSIEPGRIVAFGPGDILFMLDSSWARYREFLHLHDQGTQRRRHRSHCNLRPPAHAAAAALHRRRRPGLVQGLGRQRRAKQ
jgi:hypothetical protein